MWRLELFKQVKDVLKEGHDDDNDDDDYYDYADDDVNRDENGCKPLHYTSPPISE